MLTVKKRITITGESVIDENVVCTFSAVIDAANPEKMIVNQIQKDNEAYKAHRAECRADFAAFEDAAFAAQAEFLKNAAE